MRPADPHDVRRHNLSLVLRELAERGPRSRATLSAETGLNKSTVSSLVAELVDLGIVCESGHERPGAVGRPAQNVELDPRSPFVLGLEVNVDYLAVWAADLGGRVLHRSFVASDNRERPERVISQLELLARQALDQHFAEGRRAAAVTVAVPGIVDDAGLLVVAPNLHWEDVPVAEMLSDSLGPLTVENEANLGALAELGLVCESGHERPGAVGRPAQNVELDPRSPFVLGLEVNVDYLAVWAADLGGRVLHRSFVASDNRERPERVISRLELLARQALDQHFAEGRRAAAVTVAVPGIVDDAGLLVVAPNLHWEDVPVAEMLSESLGPLTVENEANLGALAELTEGAGCGLRDFVYISGEVGIGAGIVIGGDLFRGARGFGGEIGHLTIDAYGPPCPCGSRGCLERLAGQDAVLRLAGWDSRISGPGSRPEWPGAMLAQSAREGRAKTLEALSQVGHTLGIAAATAVNLLNPEALLLGGYFAPLTEWLRAPIESELHNRLLAGDGSGCAVLAARLGGEAAVRGAVALSRRQALDDPAALSSRALSVVG